MAKRRTRDEKWEEVKRGVEEKLKRARRRALLAESFDELEGIVEEVGREIEQELLKAIAEQLEPSRRARCPECGEGMYRRGTKARHLKTTKGKVAIERDRWICLACGTSLFPLDRCLKIEAYTQTTRRLERVVSEVGIRLPYEQTATVLREVMGIEVSGRQVEHIVDRQGQRAVRRRDAEVKAAWDAGLPIGRQPEGPEVLYIEADGSWINSREGLGMEGKVGVVHQGPEKVGEHRMALRSAVYVTTFYGSERLGEELYLEADRQGLERAVRRVFISDGDIGLRGIRETHFYDAEYVLSWFHLRRALHRALRPAMAELGDDYIAALSMTLKDLLWFGEVDLALERLKRLRDRLAAPQARDALLSLCGYIQDNRDGIHYADLHEQGIHVGSGPIEKAADLIINRRCELRGMSWYRDTADGLCNLRTQYLNGPLGWQEFWVA